MKNFGVQFLFLSFIFLALMGMEEGWDKGKGKEKVKTNNIYYDVPIPIDDFFPSAYGLEKKVEQESLLKELYDESQEKDATDNALKAILQSPSQRRRALSLSLDKRNNNSLVKKVNSKRRSLDSLFKTDSEFELQQNNVNLFDLLSTNLLNQESETPNMLQEIEAWLNIIFSRVPSQCVTLEDLIEKKYSLLKFLVDQVNQSATLENDEYALHYAENKKKAIEEDEKNYYLQVNIKDGLKYQKLALIAFEDAKHMNEVIQKEQKRFAELKKSKKQRKLGLVIEALMYKQKILYNSAQAFCAEAKQYFENAVKNGGDLHSIEFIIYFNSVNSLLNIVQSKIKFFEQYKVFLELWQKSSSLLNKAQVVEKSIKPYDEFIELIKKIEAKITTPRTNTARLTMLNKKDRKKIIRIIKKENDCIDTTKSKKQKAFSQNCIDDLTKVLDGKNREDFFKAIINYKIKKKQFNYTRTLKKIDRCYTKSTKLLFQGFQINPQLQFLVTIQRNLKYMKRIREKVCSINKKKLNKNKLKKFKESLNEYIDCVIRTQKPIKDKFEKELYL